MLYLPKNILEDGLVSLKRYTTDSLPFLLIRNSGNGDAGQNSSTCLCSLRHSSKLGNISSSLMSLRRKAIARFSRPSPFCLRPPLSLLNCTSVRIRWEIISRNFCERYVNLSFTHKLGAEECS